MGEAVVSLRFRRQEDGWTSYDVLEKSGRLFVLRQASPWSLHETWGHRVRDVLGSLVP